MFIIPAAVAEALARFASRTFHGIVDEPQVGERHSMRRHRGVYIWRPAMDQHAEPDIVNGLGGTQDVKTAEKEIQRHKQKPH